MGYAANGLIGLIFSCTGPVAVILAAGTSGGLTTAELASWIAGVFVLNGVITIAMSLAYRQPLGFAWTIPGTILVGSALRELTWPEVIGAFIVTGALILVLGLSGLVRKAMAAVPMPIVMAMVAGVFLTFGIELVKAVREDFLIAAPMAFVFVALSAMPRFGRWMPPILARADRRRDRGGGVGPLLPLARFGLRYSPHRSSPRPNSPGMPRSRW